MRYLDMTDINEINGLSIEEYNLKMKVYQLKRLDIEYFIHLQAWTNAVAKNRKKNGSPQFSNFKQFFNYEERQNEILGKKKTFSNINRRVIEYERGQNGTIQR